MQKSMLTQCIPGSCFLIDSSSGSTSAVVLPLQLVNSHGLKARNYGVSIMSLSTAYDIVQNANVTFRFVPSMAEVKAASELYENAGKKLTSFRGVPVFQAEGMYISQDNKVRMAAQCWHVANGLRCEALWVAAERLRAA
jgi:hypothetical protein